MADKTMKALTLAGPGGPAEVKDAPLPKLGADAVLVRTHYTGVSAGTEMWVATGRRWPESPADFLNPGYQAAGEIIEVGTEVKDFAPGDIVAVFCQNAHAEYVAASVSLTHKLPRAEVCKVGSLFVQPSVGANALNHADVRCGDTVYVVGQGLVGQFTAQLARLRGAYVITSDVSPARIALSERYCADWVIDASKGPVSERLKERFPNGVDVAIESTGFEALLDDAFECATYGGRFVFEGWYPDDIHYTFHLPHQKQLRAFYPSFIGPEPSRAGVIRLMAADKLAVEPLISHCVPGTQSADLYNRLFTDERNQFNGIVFEWAG